MATNSVNDLSTCTERQTWDHATKKYQE